MATSDLTIRVQRLFVTPSQDTFLRRIAVFVLVGTIAALGWINVRLVAGPPSNGTPLTITSPQEDEKEAEQYVQELAAKLDTRDETIKLFADVIRTQPGRVALGNRVSQIEEALRRKAAEEAIPKFFAELDSNVHSKMMTAIKEAKEDINELATAMADLRTRMEGSGEADQMLIRFLEHPKGPQVLYFSDVRQQMRPGRERLMQRLGRFLADDGSGKLIVRESARDELEAQIKNINKALKHVDFINEELKSWSEEVHAKDELHERVKKGLATGDRAAHILAASLDKRQNVEQSILVQEQGQADRFVAHGREQDWSCRHSGSQIADRTKLAPLNRRACL